MELTLLTPLGALIAVGVVVPLVALALLHRRGESVRRAIGLPEPRPRVVRAAVAALVVAAALLGLAAAQPRLEWTSEQARPRRRGGDRRASTRRARCWRARAPRSRIRYARATDAALRFRAAFEDVPVGIASFTDRVLPHLFPSPDEDVFAATLSRSLGIDRPPPHGAFVSTATRLAALETIVSRRFFTPTVRNRLIFVITDGESVPISGAKIAAAFRRPPGVDTIFLHVWDGDERVFDGNQPEPQYSPDPRSRGILDAGGRHARRPRLRRGRARRRDRGGAERARRRARRSSRGRSRTGSRSRRTSPARSSSRSRSCSGARDR